MLSKLKLPMRYSVCPKKYKYIFDSADHLYVEADGYHGRIDKIVLETFTQDALGIIKASIKK